LLELEIFLLHPSSTFVEALRQATEFLKKVKGNQEFIMRMVYDLILWSTFHKREFPPVVEFSGFLQTVIKQGDPGTKLAQMFTSLVQINLDPRQLPPYLSFLTTGSLSLDLSLELSLVEDYDDQHGFIY